MLLVVAADALHDVAQQMAWRAVACNHNGFEFYRLALEVHIAVFLQLCHGGLEPYVAHRTHDYSVVLTVGGQFQLVVAVVVARNSGRSALQLQRGVRHTLALGCHTAAKDNHILRLHSRRCQEHQCKKIKFFVFHISFVSFSVVFPPGIVLFNIQFASAKVRLFSHLEVNRMPVFYVLGGNCLIFRLLCLSGLSCPQSAGS